MKTDPVQINCQAYIQVAIHFAALNAAMPDSVVKRGMSLLSKIKQGGRMLDLGCGPGRDIAWFEAMGCWLIGADLSVGMLTEARKAIKGPVCLMDMRWLGYAQGSFSAVWCNAALLHLPKQETLHTIREIARVLIPGPYSPGSGSKRSWKNKNLFNPDVSQG